MGGAYGRFSDYPPLSMSLVYALPGIWGVSGGGGYAGSSCSLHFFSRLLYLTKKVDVVCTIVFLVGVRCFSYFAPWRGQD